MPSFFILTGSKADRDVVYGIDAKDVSQSPKDEFNYFTVPENNNAHIVRMDVGYIARDLLPTIRGDKGAEKAYKRVAANALFNYLSEGFAKANNKLHEGLGSLFHWQARLLNSKRQQSEEIDSLFLAINKHLSRIARPHENEWSPSKDGWAVPLTKKIIMHDQINSGAFDIAVQRISLEAAQRVINVAYPNTPAMDHGLGGVKADERADIVRQVVKASDNFAGVDLKGTTYWDSFNAGYVSFNHTYKGFRADYLRQEGIPAFAERPESGPKVVFYK